MVRAAVRAAVARPSTRMLAVVAVAAGASSALGDGAATRVGGALGGWLTAVRATAEVVLALTALGAAVAASGWRSVGLDQTWHLSGLDVPPRQRATAAAGAAIGLVLLAAFGIGAAGAGVVRAVGDGSSWWATAGYATGGVAVVARLAARIALGVLVLGALSALVGRLLASQVAAAGLALVATLPFVTVAGAVAGRDAGVLAALSWTPVGALRAVVLGQQGLAVPGLERPATVATHLVAALVWVGVVVAAEPVALRRRAGRRRSARSGGTADAHRSTSPTASTRSRRRVAATLVLAGAVTVAVAATVPPRVNEGLPWRWQPSWRSAEHSGRASHQVVAAAVHDLRHGRPPAAEVPPPVAEVLRRGDRVDVAAPRQMRRPDEVWVRVELGDGVATGDHVITAVGVRFVLEPTADGWAIVGAEGPVAIAGTSRVGSGGPT